MEGPNIQCLVWEEERESFQARETFSKAWSQDCFRNWDGKLGIVARNESGQRSRNQKMKDLVSHARVFGVYPESSQEPLKVYMLEEEGTPRTLLWDQWI